MKKTIALIPGDGIGPDVIDEAVKVLNCVANKFGHEFTYKNVIAGGKAIDMFKNPLPKEQLDICLHADSVLLGAVGGPKWDNVDASIRPEKALLGLRGGMKVFANLRPAVMFPQLKNACPLKDEIVGDGIDILIVRELTGGIYFGERGNSSDGKTAWDTEKYTWDEIERIVRLGFEFAKKRRKILTVVDKKQSGTEGFIHYLWIMPPVLFGSRTVNGSFPIQNHILYIYATDNPGKHRHRISLPCTQMVLICFIIALYNSGKRSKPASVRIRL